MTNRKSRCAALPAPELARLPPAAVTRLPPAEVAPANYRTSSNRPACHPPSVLWAHKDQLSRLWVAILSAPMPAMRSGEWQIQASSLVSREGSAPIWLLFNRNGQKKSINLIAPGGKRLSSLDCAIFRPKSALTNKMARRLVIGNAVIIVIANRYLGDKR